MEKSGAKAGSRNKGKKVRQIFENCVGLLLKGWFLDAMEISGRKEAKH